MAEHFEESDRSVLWAMGTQATVAFSSTQVDATLDTLVEAHGERLAKQYVEIQILLVTRELHAALRSTNDPTFLLAESAVRALGVLVPDQTFARLAYLLAHTDRRGPNGPKLEAAAWCVGKDVIEALMAATDHLTCRAASIVLQFSDAFPFGTLPSHP